MELSELRDDDGLLCIRIPESDGVVSFMDLFRFNVGIDIPGWCTYYVYISTIEVLFIVRTVLFMNLNPVVYKLD